MSVNTDPPVACSLSAGALTLTGPKLSPVTKPKTELSKLSGTDAGNYLIDPTISGIVVNVTPRPLTVAANSAVRYADMANATLTFDSSVLGLVIGDSFGPVSVSAPAESEHAAGGSVFRLTASGGTFGGGALASNYALTYQSGLLIVLPTPPRIGDASSDSQQQATGPTVFTVNLDAQAVQQTVNELQTASAVTLLSTGQTGAPTAKSKRQTDSAVDLAAAAAGGKDDGAAITLPALQRTPLITLDASLRRLILGGQ